jgi:hypothetical protein
MRRPRTRIAGLVAVLLMASWPLAACGVPSTAVYRFGPPPKLLGSVSNATGPYTYALYFERLGVLQPVYRSSDKPVSAQQRLKALIDGPTSSEMALGFLPSDVPGDLVWLPTQPSDQAHTMRVNLPASQLSWYALGEIDCTLNGEALGQGGNDSFGVIFPGSNAPKWNSCRDFTNDEPLANSQNSTMRPKGGATAHATPFDPDVPSDGASSAAPTSTPPTAPPSEPPTAPSDSATPSAF